MFRDIVPDEVKVYSNRNGTNYKYKGETLSEFQIVITTLILVGK